MEIINTDNFNPRTIDLGNRKDTTKYLFDRRLNNKRRLVLRVVMYYCAEYKVESLEMLQSVFPKKLQGAYGVVEDFDKAIKNPKRYFIKIHEVGQTLNGQKFVVCNQWGVGNIHLFVAQAKALGLSLLPCSQFNVKDFPDTWILGGMEAAMKKVQKVFSAENSVTGSAGLSEIVDLI